MNSLIYLFGSGAAFFIGVGFILLSLLTFILTDRTWAKVLATSAAFAGVVLVTFSSTPLPYWLYALFGMATACWLVTERSRRPSVQALRKPSRWTVAAVWVATAGFELPYHVMPTLPLIGRPQIYIIGDSISAGLGEREETWPRLLASKRSIEVTDFSRVGADVASALRQADRLPPEGGLVLLEIGGNDLLGSTSAMEFEHGLDRLLERVCVPGRTVVMFELPLPPFCNEYGRVQRRLAARHGVLLIPKRILIAVLTADTATLDSIHLTRAGHERMADAVWAVIRPAYGE